MVFRKASEGWFTQPHHRKRFKEAVAEAEAEAERHLALIGSAEGQLAARREATRLELAAIDWDDDDPLAAGANTSAAS